METFINNAPQSYSDIRKHPDKERWEQAVREELSAHERNGTWSTIDKLPEGRKAIGSMWTLKIKRDGDGNIINIKVDLSQRDSLRKNE